MIRLSNGGANAARNCKRKYFYRYERKLTKRKPPDKPALGYGKLWHKTLERWFTVRRYAGMSDFILSRGVTPDDIERCNAMLAGYIKRWPTFPLASLHEYPLEVPIRNPWTGRKSRKFTQYGILDMVALEDRIWLYEHKTASSIGGGYIEKLWSDSQITGYVAALQDSGIDVAGVVYDVALKPKLRPKKTETDTEFYSRLADWHMQPEAYHRERVLISDRQIQDWREDIWLVTQDILNCRRVGKWYRNTSRCFDYFSQCEYLPLCQNGAPEVLVNAEYMKRESPSEVEKPKPIF